MVTDSKGVVLNPGQEVLVPVKMFSNTDMIEATVVSVQPNVDPNPSAPPILVTLAVQFRIGARPGQVIPGLYAVGQVKESAPTLEH